MANEKIEYVFYIVFSSSFCEDRWRLRSTWRKTLKWAVLQWLHLTTHVFQEEESQLVLISFFNHYYWELIWNNIDTKIL